VAAQQKSVSELKRIQVGQFDATEIVQRAISAVSGKALPEALFAVALFVNPPDVKKLREQAIEAMKAAPISSSLGATIMNAA
jgi:hypothetical protein